MPQSPDTSAAPKTNPEADAVGALQGGEAHRGAPDQAPRDLGRKDPTTTGESAPDKDGVKIR